VKLLERGKVLAEQRADDVFTSHPNRKARPAPVMMIARTPGSVSSFWNVSRSSL